MHEIPKKISQNVLIATGPFFVNSILGAIIACPAAIPVLKFNSQLSGSALLVYYFLIWLGVSIAMHSFPSITDAKAIWSQVKSKETPILYKIFITPIVGLVYIGAFGSVVWLDLIYGVAIAMLIPNILINVFA